jgi:hypothetical protein
MDVLGLTDSNPSIAYRVSHAHPYASSISSSASSSSSSVFSLDGLSTQSSISSTSTTSVDVIWENEGEWQAAGRALAQSSESSSRCSRICLRGNAAKVADTAVPPELRKNPRRTNSFVAQSQSIGLPCVRPPPCLQRQSERKVNFVDNLVDSASQIVETIWPLSAVSLRSDSSTGCKGVLPLRTFIQETLRRSRTSYSTLQVALYYLIKVKPHVPKHDLTKEQPRDKPLARAMQCGRRMFLAALILASKYLQDRNYSARAWSKISGLNTVEINQNELMFLEAVGWRLHIPEALFQRWTDIVLKFTPGAGCLPPVEGQCWRTILPELTPELDTIDVEPTNPSTGFGAGFDLGLAADSPSRSIAARETSPTLPSNEQTPTCSRNLPSTLEPTPRMDCPNPSLPSIPRPPMLPTPQMTPQSSIASTPAASIGVFGRRPSICAAMSQAQNMCMARSTLDQRPALAFCTKANSLDSYPVVRRSSLARSTSSASSPESMISDISTLSSRSSRSSSVSSIASGTCAPNQPRLAVTATRRCANALSSLKESRKTLMIASPIDEACLPEIYSSPDAYTGPSSQVPDLSNFSLGTPIDLTASAQEAAHSLCELSRPLNTSDPSSADVDRRCRKRGRTGSEDLLLQNHVRHLINLQASQGDEAVLPDRHLADSFLIPEAARSESLSAHQLSSLKLPHPLSGPVGMKRACCGSEARKIGLSSGMRSGFMN